MIASLLAEASNISKDPSLSSQFFSLAAISLGSGGIIATAIKQILDSNRIKIIVELQAEIKSLQREIKHQEEDIEKLEAENTGLKNQVEILREKSDSSMNTQLVDLQEKYNQLSINYKKLARINRSLKENKQ